MRTTNPLQVLLACLCFSTMANARPSGPAGVERPRSLGDRNAIQTAQQKKRAAHPPRKEVAKKRTGLKHTFEAVVVEIADDVLLARAWPGPGAIEQLRRLGYAQLGSQAKPKDKSFRGQTVFVRYPMNHRFAHLHAGDRVKVTLQRDDTGYMRVERMRKP